LIAEKTSAFQVKFGRILGRFLPLSILIAVEWCMLRMACIIFLLGLFFIIKACHSSRTSLILEFEIASTLQKYRPHLSNNLHLLLQTLLSFTETPINELKGVS
jgi:hypothetical protein